MYFAETPWYENFSVGGYYHAQKTMEPQQSAKVVLLDLGPYVASRKTTFDPADKDSTEWPTIAARWTKLAEIAGNLQQSGAKGIFVDWELALRTQYLAFGTFDDERIPRHAQEAYKALLTKLLEVDGKGCPVFIGSDWVLEQTDRARRPEMWFPIKDAQKLAVTLRGPTERKGPFTAYSDVKSGNVLPTPAEAMAKRLGDHLYDSFFLGFNFGLSSIDHPHELPPRFWIDYSRLNHVPLKLDQVGDKVRDKVVVLAFLEDREAEDTAVLPNLDRPGAYFHGAAIGTRLNRPIYAPASHKVEWTYLFFINLGIGLIALWFGCALCRWMKLYPHDHRAEGMKLVADIAVSGSACLVFISLSGNVATTRLLLPMIPAMLIVRLLEPMLIALRFVYLVKPLRPASEELQHAVESLQRSIEQEAKDITLARRANLQETLAETYHNLGDRRLEILSYEMAASAYHAAGDHASESRCREKVKQLSKKGKRKKRR